MVTEKELAESAVAERVTTEDIDNAIVDVRYFTAAEGVAGHRVVRGDREWTEGLQPLSLMTFCVLTLFNGYTVHGISACAAPENFNEHLGRKLAYEDARNKVWPLLGFQLKTKLWEREQMATTMEPTIDRKEEIIETSIVPQDSTGSLSMKLYQGTKTLYAKPMTRGDYNKYQGWEIPHNEDASEEGYLVEYTDGGKANHPKHKGYISWSPKDVFERTYVPLLGSPSETTGSFSSALKQMKLGRRVARQGWNGKGMWLKLVPETLAAAVAFQHAALDAAPWIGMKTADEKFVPWLASQTDLLANDWVVLEE